MRSLRGMFSLDESRRGGMNVVSLAGQRGVPRNLLSPLSFPLENEGWTGHVVELSCVAEQTPLTLSSGLRYKEVGGWEAERLVDS